MDNEFKRLLNGANWAETGDRALPSDPTISPQIVRAEGLPIEYSETVNLSRRRFNQILRELYGAAREVGLGISAYDAEVTYPVGSITQINGNLYYAVTQNSPSSPVNPATPDQTAWERIGGRGLQVKTIPDVIPASDIFIRNDLADKFYVWWSPPNDGGSEITSTQLRYSKTNTFPAASTTTVTYTQGQEISISANDANQYYISLRAINAIDDNPNNWSPATKVRNDALLPGPVNTLQGFAGTASKTIRLTWSPPTTNGLTIANYRIQWKSGSQNFSTSLRTALVAANVRTYDVTNLNNGTTYDFRVSAISNQTPPSTNTDGNIVRIEPVNAPRVAGAPTITSESLTPNSAYIAVTGIDPGTAAIQRYEYQITLATDTTFTNNVLTSPNNENSAPFVLVTGLAANTNYIIRVRAYNGVGDPDGNAAGGLGFGAWSSTFSMTTQEADEPDAPEITLLRPKGDTLIGFVSNDVDDNLSDITNYAYRYRASGSNDWLPSSSGVTISGGLSGFERNTGILPGTTYQVQMRVENSIGWGDWSSTATSTFTPAVPPAPNISITRTTNQSAQITITPSMNTGGAEILEYEVDYKLSTAQNWTTSTGHTSTYIVMTQINGTSTYKVRVRARNSAGWGNYSSTDGVDVSLTVAVPLKPTIQIFRDTNRPRILKVIFTPNTTPDAVQPTSYRYGWTVAGTSGWQYVTLNETAANLYLDARTSWDIRAQAINSAGNGAWSNSTAVAAGATVPPTAPAPTLDRVNGNTLCYFVTNDRISDGGSNITSWEIRYKATDESNWSDTITTTVAGGSISGLDATKTYEVQMKFRNLVGASANWSPSAQRGFTVQVPTAPAVTVYRVRHVAMVVVFHFQDTGGAPITKFQARYRRGVSIPWTTVDSSNPGIVINPEEFSGDRNFEIEARMENSAGWSEYTTATSNSTATEPDTPTVVLNRSSNGDIVWFLSSHIDNGGDTITGYRPRWRLKTPANSPWIGGNTIQTAGGIITSLSPSDTYLISAAVRNSIGWSEWSSSVEASAVGTGTVPAQPSIITYRPDPQTIRVNFRQLNNTGGLSLTKYRIRYRKSTSSTWLPSDNGTDQTNESFEITTSGTDANADYWVQGGVQNSVGWSAWSAVSEIDKTLGTPDKPTIQVIRPENNKLIVIFKQIDYDNSGEQDITRYESRYRKTTETSNSDWHNSSVGTNSVDEITVNNTDQNSNLTVQGRVRGVDDSFWSNWSTSITSNASIVGSPVVVVSDFNDVTNTPVFGSMGFTLFGGGSVGWTGVSIPTGGRGIYAIMSVSNWHGATPYHQKPIEWRCRGLQANRTGNRFFVTRRTSGAPLVSSWFNPYRNLRNESQTDDSVFTTDVPILRTQGLDGRLVYESGYGDTVYELIQIQARVRLSSGYSPWSSNANSHYIRTQSGAAIRILNSSYYLDTSTVPS